MLPLLLLLLLLLPYSFAFFVSYVVVVDRMFELIRDFDMHMTQHFTQLSIATPRGIGFADEAEKASDYIVSGISGNYEKSLENSPAAVKEYSRSTNSHYRGIAADIIDSALLNGTDYTGKTLADGTKANGMYEDARVTAAAAAAEAAASG